MTFNIQHGLNGAGQYDLKYASQTITAVNPDIVGVQELTRNHPRSSARKPLITILVATFAVK